MRQRTPRAIALWLGASLVLILASCDLAPTAWGVTRAAAARSPRPGDPIPVGGPTVEMSPDSAVLDSWYERVFLGSYRKVGRRSRTWDADAEAFIRISAAAMLHGAWGGTGADLVARGRNLVAKGCDDPMILYLAARAEDRFDPKSRAGTELLERALAGMHDVPYPRVVAFRVAEALRADYEESYEGVGKREAVAPLELRWFLESLDDGSYRPDEDAVLARVSGECGWFVTRNRAAIGAAVEQRPWVDPWLRLYLAGERAIDDAWDSRGKKYSNKVTDQGWMGFEESIEAARKALTASWQARQDRPEAAAAMVTVAMAAGRPDESPRLWFDRAVRAQFDYSPAYNRLINALRVRWCGDPSALPDFARACAATRRFDTSVPFVAFRAVERMEWDLIWESHPVDEETDELLPLPLTRRPPSVYRDASLYDTVAAVLERYRREPGDSEGSRYASLQAAIAYKAGRYEDARRFLHDSSGVLSAESRRAVDEPFLEARIVAHAGPDGGVARRAEELYDDHRAGEAAALFEKALAHADPAARPYLTHRLAGTTMEAKLSGGEAARFLPSAGLDGWTPREGKWTVEPDGSLLGTSGRRGLLIVADSRIGDDFEIEADVEIATTSNGQFQAGIVFGEAPSFPQYRWSSFRWKKTAHEGEVVYFSQHFSKPVHSIQRAVPLRNHVRLRSWNGRLSAWVNGELAVSEYAPEWRPPRGPDNQVGFGAYLDDNTFSVRFRDVKLQRLMSASRPEPR